MTRWEKQAGSGDVWALLDDDGVARHWVFKMPPTSGWPEPHYDLDQGPRGPYRTLADAQAAAEALLETGE